MTPKEKVLKRLPQAHCRNDQNNEGLWEVFPRPFGQERVWPIGKGKTPKAAWKDAAR